MALLKHFVNQKYQWGIWELTESFDELLNTLPDKGEMYSRGLKSFTSESRKREWIAARVLLYKLAGEEKKISYHRNGKPYFADKSGYISISHTKGYVAVIVSPQNEVGIDIEKYGERIHKVAHKFVRPDEDAHGDMPEATTKRLLIWSAKEVMFKCMNAENVDFLEDLKIDTFPLGQYWMMAHETRTEKRNHFLIHYVVHNDFVMTWTVC